MSLTACYLDFTCLFCDRDAKAVKNFAKTKFKTSSDQRKVRKVLTTYQQTKNVVLEVGNAAFTHLQDETVQSFWENRGNVSVTVGYKLCRAYGCEKQAVTTEGLCYGHGDPKKNPNARWCKHPSGCEKHAQNGFDVCISHGAESPKCTYIGGCKKKRCSQYGPFCSKHGKHLYNPKKCVECQERNVQTAGQRCGNVRCMLKEQEPIEEDDSNVQYESADDL